MITDNYIFDLYGTLIDIHTDEQAPELWEAVCDHIAKELSQYITASNKAILTDPAKLKEGYFEMDRQERVALSKRLGTEHPEIRIEWVWERLLSDKP